MSGTAPWPGDWLRGVLEVCVLRVLADGPTYGYAIGARLAEVGLGSVKGGTLYPLLARFETAGLVAVEWRAGEGGPGRRYYVLTEDGTRAWRAQAARWARFAGITTDLVTSVPAPASDLASASAADPAPDDEVGPGASAPDENGTHVTTGPQAVRNGARR